VAGGAAVAPDINAPDISAEKRKGDGEKNRIERGGIYELMLILRYLA
jgi:hypothetical protein